jgi:hypothetical protein
MSHQFIIVLLYESSIHHCFMHIIFRVTFCQRFVICLRGSCPFLIMRYNFEVPMETTGKLSQVVCNYILRCFGTRVLDYLETHPSRQQTSCCVQFNISSLKFCVLFHVFKWMLTCYIYCVYFLLRYIIYLMELSLIYI